MRILTTLQREEWTRAVQRATQYDFYFLPEYHALAERRGEGEARLFVYEQAGHTIALPLIIRTLTDYPGIGGWAQTWRDATSVYGYSGPLCSHNDIPRAVVDGFQRDLITALRELQRSKRLLPTASVAPGPNHAAGRAWQSSTRGRHGFNKSVGYAARSACAV